MTPLARLYGLADRLDEAGTPVPCRGPHRDRWIDEDEDTREWARAHCGGCPLIRPCLTAAIDARAEAGVWGAADLNQPATRRALRRLTERQPA